MEPRYGRNSVNLIINVKQIMSIHYFEFGDGFAAAELLGSENNDAPTPEGWAGNHSGGILGGMSNGNTIIFRIAVKPTPSISLEQTTVDKANNAVKCVIHGRHDPCIVPRAVPVIEAAAAIAILDSILDEKAN